MRLQTDLSLHFKCNILIACQKTILHLHISNVKCTRPLHADILWFRRSFVLCHRIDHLKYVKHWKFLVFRKCQKSFTRNQLVKAKYDLKILIMLGLFTKRMSHNNQVLYDVLEMILTVPFCFYSTRTCTFVRILCKNKSKKKPNMGKVVIFLQTCYFN